MQPTSRIWTGSFLAAALMAGAAAQAVPLRVAFDGQLNDAAGSNFSLQFDLDTAAAAGGAQTGSCRDGGTTVAGVYTGFGFSGGISNASFNVDGHAADTMLSGSSFTYGFDFSDLCKFYVGFNLDFASGLSIRSADQVTGRYYLAVDTSPADFFAGVLRDSYGGIDVGSVLFAGERIGFIQNSTGSVKVVPEPLVLGLFGGGLLGVLLLRRQRVVRAQ